jgi:hypothetical protein
MPRRLSPAARLALSRAAAAMLVALLAPVGLAAVSVTLAGVAQAQDDIVVCTREPKEHWMSPAAISQKAMRAGYPEIRRVTVVGSCYEIEALTARRMQADVVMDPVTGDVVHAWMDRLPD